MHARIQPRFLVGISAMYCEEATIINEIRNARNEPPIKFPKNHIQYYVVEVMSYLLKYF